MTLKDEEEEEEIKLLNARRKERMKLILKITQQTHIHSQWNKER